MFHHIHTFFNISHSLKVFSNNRGFGELAFLELAFFVPTGRQADRQMDNDGRRTQPITLLLAHMRVG